MDIPAVNIYYSSNNNQYIVQHNSKILAYCDMTNKNDFSECYDSLNSQIYFNECPNTNKIFYFLFILDDWEIVSEAQVLEVDSNITVTEGTCDSQGYSISCPVMYFQGTKQKITKKKKKMVDFFLQNT